MKSPFQMNLPAWFPVGTLWLSVSLAGGAPVTPGQLSRLPAPADRPVDFEKDIAPIFAQACFKCHGPDKQKSNFRLDLKPAALKGGDNGVAILPGKSADSPLIQFVSGLVEDMVMPQKGERLTVGQIGLLRAWIDQGAVWPETRAGADPRLDHWAFQPLQRPAVPAVKENSRARNPIDHFVLARLEKEHLKPAPEADRATLIRRLTFDLHGLPPSPAEVDAFVADKSPDALERLVDHLLASPRYGERWARHWLDLARFCESNGFEHDRIREHSWRYRDYVIASFNDDKPYPQFVREQIAGDALEPPTAEGIIATGFLVAGPWDEAGNRQASVVMRARLHEEELEDTISAVGQTFLGLTINCARCHDHKFDPIPQSDYYRFKAAFEGVRHGDRPILTPEELKAHNAEVAQIKKRIAGLTNQIANLEQPDRQKVLDEVELQQAALKALPVVPLAYAASPKSPEPTFVLARGDVLDQREQVTAGGMSAIKSLPADFGLAADAAEDQRRVKLAGWITRPDNPLFARVMVNRLWQHHFGRGLVGTPNDFGHSGERPSHPELLDWLASEFIAQGWSLKQMHRLILLSGTWRQSSQFNEKAATADADNRLLWRFAPHRLEAEAVRDAMLAVSGQINLQMGGPGFRPFDLKINNSYFYTAADHLGPEFNRRTVYRIGVQSAKNPLLDSLDCPDFSTKTPVRGITTTPIQALALMNNSFVLRQARQFAERLQTEAGRDLSAQVERAYRFACGRKPTGEENRRAAALAREHGLESFCWVLFNASEFLYVR